MLRLLKKEMRLIRCALLDKRCSSPAERAEVQALLIKLESALRAPNSTAIASWHESFLRNTKLPAGTRVAIHQQRGIVAQGKNISQVIAQVRQLGLSGLVVYDTIPN